MQHIHSTKIRNFRSWPAKNNFLKRLLKFQGCVSTPLRVMPFLGLSFWHEIFLGRPKAGQDLKFRILGERTVARLLNSEHQKMMLQFGHDS